MEPIYWSAINSALIAIAAIACIPRIRDAFEVSRTEVTEMLPNSNAEAIQIVLKLLDEANSELIMYDDGDTADDSLYQNEALIFAIKEKIRKNPDFQVLCVLNHCAGETRFEQALTALPNVSIRQRRISQQSRVHYKIIDGRKAYVTCHELGQVDRNRKMIDCANAMSRRKNTRPLALRRYFEDFEHHAA